MEASFFGHGTLLSGTTRVHHHPLIVANSTNLSRMNSRRQSCSNKFDLTRCDQCKAARKQTKNSLSLAIDLSEIDAAAISLLASRMSNRVQSSESAALFFPVRLFTYRRLTCSLLPAAHKHHALSLLSCFKSDSDYVLCSHNTTQNSNTLEHHYFYLTFFFFLLYFGFFSFISTSRKTQNRHFERFFGV